MFQHLLREEAIQVRLEAGSREALLAEMVAMLPSRFLNSKQKSEALELLLQREKFGTTAVGEGVALPRCTLSNLSSPVICLGISRNGIQYPSLDGEPVHLILLSIFPEDSAYDQARRMILQSAESILKDRFLKERLKISETPEEAFEIVLRESEVLWSSLPLAGNQ